MQKMEFLELLNCLTPADFMPHGYCYLWGPWQVWLPVLSDEPITISYHCIPIVLIHFIRKRGDQLLNWIFWMFGAHLITLRNIWHGSYELAGVISPSIAEWMPTPGQRRKSTS